MFLVKNKKRPLAGRCSVNDPTLIVPQELASYKQFVVWRYETRNGGKPTKRPYDPKTGRPASVNDPSTWASYEEALAALQAGGYDGLGFVLTPDDPFAVFDLDDALDESGELKPWAAEIVRRLNSYTELSPSRRGLHIWCRVRDKARLPSGRKRGDLEFYTSGRYLTVTGERLPDAPAEITERQAELEALLEELFAGESPSSETTEEELGDLPDLPSEPEIAALLRVAEQLVPDCKNLLFGDWPEERQDGLDRSKLEYLLARRLVECGLRDLRTIAVIVFGSAIHEAKADGRSPEASWKLAVDCARHALEGGPDPQESTSLLQRAKPWPQFVAEAEPVSWLWKPLVARRHLTILAGDPGVGKSTLLRRLLWALESGDPEFLSLPVRRPSKTLIVTEEGPTTWREMYCGALTSTLFLSADEIASTDDWQRLCTELETFDGELVVVDSFNAIFHGESINEAAEINAHLRPLAKAARRASFAALILDHHRKGADGTESFYGRGVAGSYAKIGSADIVVSLRRAEADKPTGRGRTLRLEKSRLSAPPELLEGVLIEMAEDGTYILRGSKCSLAAEKWTEEEMAILQILDEAGRNGSPWVKPAQIRQATGMSRDRLAKHIDALEDVIIANGRGGSALAYALRQYVLENFSTVEN